LIGEFSQAFPDIRLVVTSHDSIINLLEHKTDIAIRIGDLSDSNLHARQLGISKLHLVASPNYLKNHPISGQINSLTNHKLIGSSGETIRHFCLAGQGIALLSNFMGHRDIAAGSLVSIFEDKVMSPNRRETIQAVYYKNSAVSSRISAFLDFIQPKLTL
jgi:DNA-binding transcriptional LysR family regulator